MPPIEPLFFASAFFAGFFMFLAPCTLPLLPAYIGFISGVTEKELNSEETKKRSRRQVVKQSFMFVLGFAAVFISIGILAVMLGGVVTSRFSQVLSILGGALIILFGFFMVGGLKLPFLQKERRFTLPQWATVGTPVSALLLGGAFAVGWSPCIGPVYGTILIYASTMDTILIGTLLLIIFVSGFAAPFILTAVLINQTAHLITRVTPYLRIISVFGGVVLIILGLSLLLGHTVLTNWFFSLFEYLDFKEMLLPYL